MDDDDDDGGGGGGGGGCSDGVDSRSFDVEVQLPTVNIVSLPVYVELDIPSVISVQSSAALVYTIHNRSDCLQDFDVIVESSDTFMFAGHRQVSGIRHCCACWTMLVMACRTVSVIYLS